jgi:hypothetical protein
MLDKRLLNVIGWTILIAWCISMVLDVALKNYSPPPTIHGLMMALVGTAFGATSVSAWRKGSDDSKTE